VGGTRPPPGRRVRASRAATPSGGWRRRAGWRLPIRYHANAVQLVLNGIVDRYAGARILLAHAGSFVPYASYRFAELARVFRPDAAKLVYILASFRRLYFDNALSSSAAALPSPKSFAENGRILFGTDFPYAPADIAASFTAKLDAYDGLTADEHAAINHGNALTLFPRLAVTDTSRESVKTANVIE